MADTNLNQFLQPQNSPAVAGTTQPAFKFGIEQKVQARNIRTSRINIKNFALLSNNANATASINNAQTLTFSSTLTPQAPHQADISFSVPFMAIYQGTNPNSLDANFQIYPTIGGSITPGQYVVQCMLDWHVFNGTTSSIGGAITNNTGGAQNIIIISQWKYAQYNSGTVT